jgi:hypothetical protein
MFLSYCEWSVVLWGAIAHFFSALTSISEKDTIGSEAGEIAGKDKVDNHVGYRRAPSRLFCHLGR